MMEEEEVELLSPNKHIMQNNSHRKLTGNWQISCTIKACPEDLHVTREKASGPVSVPLGGICKEQKVQREWINPQFVHFHASSRVLYEQSSPLACWEICQDRQNNGNHPIKTADRQTNEKNESNIMRSMG